MMGKDPTETLLNGELEEIEELVSDARQRIRVFAGAKNRSEMNRFLGKNGLNEGLVTLLRLARIDGDGDGKLTETEVEGYFDHGGLLVASYLDSFASGAVITALVLTMVFPYAYETTCSNEPTFGEILEYASFQVSMLFCLAVLTLYASLYTQLAFMLPTLHIKLWYINQVKSLLGLAEGCKIAGMVIGTAAVTVHQYRSSVLAGIIATLPPACAFAIQQYFFTYFIQFKMNPALHRYAKRMVSTDREMK